MSLQNNCQVLIKRYQFNQNRCLLELNQLKNEEKNVECELMTIQDTQQKIVELLHSRKLYGEITLDYLQTFQRSEAALRREIANLSLKKKNLLLKKDEIIQKSLLVNSQQKIYRFKCDKYTYLKDKIRREKMKLDNFIQETEIEEQIACKK